MKDSYARIYFIFKKDKDTQRSAVFPLCFQKRSFL